MALESLGNVGRFIIWVGLSGLENGVAQLYVYDTETGEFKELEGKRVSHRELYPAKIHLLGTRFYFTGWNGKVMRLKLISDN